VPNRTWSWSGMGDGFLVIGVTGLALVLGALASDLLSSERPMQLVAGHDSSPQPEIVSGTTPDAGTVDCQCPVLTVAPGRARAHPARQAVGRTVIVANDGDRRRDFMVMSVMIGRRHASTALTLQPYQLSLSPEDSSAGVATRR
jgi:hypothetical protein